MRTGFYKWLLGAMLVTASILLNKDVLGFDFIYLRDDDVNITLNPHMGALNWSRLAWLFTDTDYVRRYIPLGWLGFVTTYTFAGLDPYYYHLEGLFFLALNTLLVFFLSLRLQALYSSARSGPPADTMSLSIAAVMTALWALHPLRVETTAWISGNLYGQAIAFLLLAWLAYLRSYHSLSDAGRQVWLGSSAFLYTLSLLTYPVGLAFPILLLIGDFIFSPRATRDKPMRLCLEKAWFLVPLAGVFIVTVRARFANADIFGAVPSLAGFSLWQRTLQSAYIVCYYLWRPFWPVGLSPVYDSLAKVSPGDPILILDLVTAVIITGLAIIFFRRARTASLLWFAYLASLVPFLGLTERPFVASDRYAYFLTVGVVGAGAVWLNTQRRTGWARLMVALSICALPLIAILSGRQRGIWRDDVTQHRYIVAGLHEKGFRDQNLSREQILQIFRGNRVAAQAIIKNWLLAEPDNPSFRKAQAILDDDARSRKFYGDVPLLAALHEQLALSLAQKGDWREAHDHFAEALRLEVNFYQAAYNDAICLLHLGARHSAVHRYLQARSRAASSLSSLESQRFFESLLVSASSAGDTGWTEAARASLARLPQMKP